MSNFAPSTATESRVELKIPASAQWVRVARLTVAGVASRLHFGIEEIEDIKLAVAEAINNAILHAPIAPGDDATITVIIESDENGLWISVADEGRVQGGIQNQIHGQVQGDIKNDAGAAEKALRGRADELPEGGLGLLLIRSLMDEVTHQSGAHADTVVKMFKRLPEKSSRAAMRAPRA